MKVGVVVSTVFHAALLGFGLVTLSAPRALEVADVEAFPVDIVPIDTITQVQQGDRKAPLAERATPVPTQRPHEVPDARNVGDNKVDQQTPPTPKPAEREVKTASTPPPSPEPAPKPAPTPREAPAAPQQPAAVPAIEQTQQAQPPREVTPAPAPETAVAENAEAEAVKLPETAPSPMARPEPPQAQTAKAPDRRDAERPVEQQAQRQQSTEKEFDADEVAALLNKQSPAGGGARRSTETAALGGRKTTTGAKLTQSEEAALRQQLSGCWSIPVGAADVAGLRASIRFNLDQAGKLEGRPRVDSSSGNQQFDESAVRAVLKCDQAGLLVPEGKHEIWAEVLVNFDPAEMF